MILRCACSSMTRWSSIASAARQPGRMRDRPWRVTVGNFIERVAAGRDLRAF